MAVVTPADADRFGDMKPIVVAQGLQHFRGGMARVVPCAHEEMPW
jgi:hypothetical protein